MTDTIRGALEELVDSLIDTDQACEVDAGCDGAGPVAQALVALGRFPDLESATDSFMHDGEGEADDRRDDVEDDAE